MFRVQFLSVYTSLSIANYLNRKIDLLCEQFESAWQHKKTDSMTLLRSER